MASKSRGALGFQTSAASPNDSDRRLMRERVLEAVKDAFRPEFLNRIDEVIVFDRLAPEQLRQIVDKMLRDVRARLAARQIELTLSDSAADWLIEHGYDEAYGARSLRRLVQREIENVLARRVLAAEVGSGEGVVVGTGADGLTFEVVQPMVPATVSTAA